MFCVSWELCYFRVFNPTTRPIEIRCLVFESLDPDEKRWIQRCADSTLPSEPFVLQPFTSHDFALSFSQGMDLLIDRIGRLRVKTGSGREYVEAIKGRPKGQAEGVKP